MSTSGTDGLLATTSRRTRSTGAGVPGLVAQPQPSFGAATAVSVAAQAEPLSVRTTFRIGTGGSILCSAQSLGTDRALTDMFDRGYALVCRDDVLSTPHAGAFTLDALDDLYDIVIGHMREALQ